MAPGFRISSLQCASKYAESGASATCSSVGLSQSPSPSGIANDHTNVIYTSGSLQLPLKEDDKMHTGEQSHCRAQGSAGGALIGRRTRLNVCFWAYAGVGIERVLFLASAREPTLVWSVNRAGAEGASAIRHNRSDRESYG